MQHVIRALAIAATFAVASIPSLGCNWPPTGNGGTGSTATPTTPAGDPPVLTDASMSGAATPSNGVYTIFGSLTYSCDDDVVETVRISVPVVGKSYDFPSLNPQSVAYGQPFEFTLVDDIPFAGAGATNYSIILITKGGVQSTPFPETVDLQ